MQKAKNTLKIFIVFALLTIISGYGAASEKSGPNKRVASENLRIVKKESDVVGKNSNAASSDIEQNDKVSNGNNIVTFNSFGKVKTGMTVSQAAQALGTELVGKAEDGMDCYYANPKQGFKGVRFMVTNKTIARIEIESKDYATDKGAKIGDTEDKIKSLYSGVEVNPQKYDEKKHDMEVYSAGKKHLIIFETDGKVVTGFRAGKAEEVGYVEGCS